MRLGASDELGQGVGRRQLHLIVPPPGPDVEHPSEEPGEAAGVVDLVGIVRPPGRHDLDVRSGFLGLDLRDRVGHGEDDRVTAHGLDVLQPDDAGTAQSDEHVGVHQRLARGAAEAFRIRVLGEPLLHRVHVFRTPAVDRARPVAADDVFGAGFHEELRGGDPRGPHAGEHDPHVAQALAHDLQGVEEGLQAHDRRAVLVVVEDGDVEVALQSLLDFEAPRGRDILQVDAAEHRRDGFDDGHDLVHVLGGQAEREGVDPGALLEDERLALHDRLGAVGADVAEPEHGGAVRHDGDAVLLDGQRVRLLGILVDGHADASDARRVGHGEIVAGLDRNLPSDLDLPAEVHEKRAIGDVDDANTGHGPNPFDDLLGMALVARLDAEIARDRRLAHLDEIDGADVAAGLADGRRYFAQHPRLVFDLETHGDAMTRARSVDHYPSRTAVTTAIPVFY